VYCVVIYSSLSRVTGTVPVALATTKALKESDVCSKVALVVYDKPNWKLLRKFFPELYAEPDSVISTGELRAGLFDFLRLLFGKKVIINVHADLIPYSANVNYFHTYPLGTAEELSLNDASRYKLYEAFAHSGSINLANSLRTARQLKRFGINAHVLYPPVPVPQIPPRVGGDYVLYFGRISPEKGIETVLWLADRMPDEKFIIAGKPEYPYADEIVKEAKKRKNVEVKLFVSAEEKWELLRNAKAFIHPRADEPFGIAPLEAVMLGTPAFVPCPAGVAEVLSKVIPCWRSREGLFTLLGELNKIDMHRAIREAEECCSFNTFARNLEVYVKLASWEQY